MSQALKHPFCKTADDVGMGEARATLHGLDGLRGAAALAVVILHVHLHDLLGVKPFATHAYLAVDLFFMISGFILAEVYGERLARGGGVGDFMRRRLNRLLPLYLLGAVLGLAAFALSKPEAAAIGPAGVGLIFVLALALLPRFVGGAPELNAFPLNPPSWSLSLELWGNLVYAALAPRLSNRVLGLCVVAGASVLVAVAILGGDLNYGWRQADAWVGWVRFLFAFSAGVGLQRLWAAGRIPASDAPDWLAPVILAGLLLAPAGAGPVSVAFDLAAVFLIFPAMVVAALGVRQSRARGVLAFGARLSYPLYATHAATIMMVRWAASGLHAGRTATAFAGLILALAFALAMERWFDAPVRAWLERRRLSAAASRAVPAA